MVVVRISVDYMLFVLLLLWLYAWYMLLNRWGRIHMIRIVMNDSNMWLYAFLLLFYVR